jgi:hypothetical protein
LLERIGFDDGDDTFHTPAMQPRGTAVVTGASRGVGRAIAVDLAQAGFDVMVDEVGATTGSITAQRLDVNESASIELPDDIRVLVNNAGIERDYLPVEHTPEEHWRDVRDQRVRTRGGHPPRHPVDARQRWGSDLQHHVVEVMPGPVESDMLFASERIAEGAQFEEYRAMAEAAYEGRMQVTDQYTRAPVAAAAIRAAILCDDGQMRYGCEPMSFGVLEMWRSSSDEEVFTAITAQG